MRDDFSKSVKEILSKRVGLLCSNPNCKKPTFGPHSNENKTINTGVAVHITAASFGGPRFNPNLTPKERSSILNAIWLCQSCAKMIDSDPNKYPKELLTTWKNQAENYADRILNMKIEPNQFEDYSNIFDLMPNLISEIKSDLKKIHY